MKIRTREAAAFVLAVAFSTMAQAQIFLTPMTVAAGGAIQLEADFGADATCNDAIEVTFQPLMAVRGDADAKSLKLEARLDLVGGRAWTSVPVPQEIAIGDYQIQVGPSKCLPRQFANGFIVRDRTLTVTPPAGMDGSASRDSSKELAELREFLASKAEGARDLNSALVSNFNRTPANRRRNFLAERVQAGLQVLGETESGYREKVRGDANPPAFFAEFRMHYLQLDKDLKSASPGGVQSGARTGTDSAAHLQVVAAQQATTLPKFLGSLASAASALWNLQRDISKAFRILGETGRYTFTAEITSEPDGVRVFYRKSGDKPEAYMLWGRTSASVGKLEAKLDLAYTFFKFEMEGCADDIEGPFDPFLRDPDEPVSVKGVLKCDKK
jgi:hypothetical protein